MAHITDAYVASLELMSSVWHGGILVFLLVDEETLDKLKTS